MCRLFCATFRYREQQSLSAYHGFMAKNTVKPIIPTAMPATTAWAANTWRSRRWQPTQTFRLRHRRTWRGQTKRPQRWQLMTSGLPQKTQYMGEASRHHRARRA